MSVEEEARQFWRNKEKEKGGTVSYYTFSTFLGRSGDRMLNLTGLLYIVGSRIFFEDFEKESWLIKLLNRKSEYEKTEFSVPLEEIVDSRVITRTAAMNCVEGFVGIEETRELGGVMRVLAKPVLQINLHNGTA
ncbi:MAG: hypothetical protein ACOC8N_09155, partial [Spirochaetota bacterium]